jgi:hypothetical protein
VTHDEAVALLPSYALGTLDEDVAALEAHLDACDRCGPILAALLETTAALADSVEQVPPPVALRERVLSGLAPPRPALAVVPATAPGRVTGFRPRPPRVFLIRSIAAALIILALGFGAGTVVQVERSRASQAELALDRQGLALLTSTETTVERLVPIAEPTSTAHGYWYHHAGVPTQVVVIEFLPPLTGGDAYYGWLGLAEGSWQAIGAIPTDEVGYGRSIVLGSDGAGVQSVEVTSQPGPSASPTGVVILKWPAPSG